jgi:hypothetical protein
VALRSHCGGQRFAYNWGLALVRANLAQREAERSYGVPDDRLTPSLSWSAYSLRKSWNQAKDDLAPWWAENSKEAYSSGLVNLAAALGNWIDSRTGKRRGPTVRFPRFKGKRAARSCRFTTGAFGLADSDRRYVKLPRIGLVRTHESTRKLARHIERGAARIRSATVAHRRGRWFVSLSVEITRDDPVTNPLRPGRTRLSVWIWGSSPWPCCRPASPRRTRSISTSRCGNYGGCSAKPPDARDPTGAPGPARRGAGRRRGLASPGCTPLSRTPDGTGCTSCRPVWCGRSARSWSKTSTWQV